MDQFFHNRACERAANILTAQAQDLGLTEIEQYANGEVSGVLKGVTYVFRWDVMSQKAILVHRHDPVEMLVLELAA